MMLSSWTVPGLLALALTASCGGKAARHGHDSAEAGSVSTVGGNSGQAGADAHVADKCGDGKRTGNEVCDGQDFGGATCQSEKFTAGKLECTQDCRAYDTSACRRVVSVAAGYHHSCALFEDGRIKCWGENEHGELGYGDTGTRGDEPGEMGDVLPYVDLGRGHRATAVAASSGRTCALLDDGSVKCWGDNAQGQLGLGDTDSRGDEPEEMGDALPAVDLGVGRRATAIALGCGHACALVNDGLVKCWGLGAAGVLGLGDTSNRGDEPGEMGDTLPLTDLGTNRRAVQLAVGCNHTCVLLDDDSVKCWGYDEYGQLGYGDTEYRGDDPGEMGNALPGVDLGRDARVERLAAGHDHTCALSDHGQVRCWGANGTGVLGLGARGARGDGPGEMGDALPFVDLGSGAPAVAVAGGGGRTCVIVDAGQVKCWGENGSGALGHGTSVLWWGDEPDEMGSGLPVTELGTGSRAAELATGSGHTCALLDDASMKCWGRNREGELGLGDTEPRGDTPEEMGDGLPALEL